MRPAGASSPDGFWLRFDWANEQDPEGCIVTAHKPIGDGWAAEAELRVAGGGFVFNELRFTPYRPLGWANDVDQMVMVEMEGADAGGVPEKPLSAGILRRFGLPDFHREVRERLDKLAGVPASWIDNYAAVPRPGRAGRSDAFYALWARRYVNACREHPGRPVAWLVETHGLHHENTLRSILHKARSRGLLTKAEAGKPGGRLTKKAEKLLVGIEEDD